MIWFDFDISQFFIVENSKQRISFNTDVLQICLFGKLAVILIFKQALENSL